MHLASEYLQSIRKLSVSSSLTNLERQILGLRLNEDACNYYQSALVSFVDAITSTTNGFYSWATVKLYYAVFYALRARLALAGHCIFYENGKGRLVSTSLGSQITKSSSSSTHKTVLSCFEVHFPNDFFLTQEIDAVSPLKWFIDKREEANYKQGRFSEPIAPEHLSFAARMKVRQMLIAYSAEDLYVHDKDHAIVAFPYRLLLDLRGRLLSSGLRPLGQSEVDFISVHMRDKTGVITAALALF